MSSFLFHVLAARLSVGVAGLPFTGALSGGHLGMANRGGSIYFSISHNRGVGYAAPIGAFFCPEIRAFTGFGVRFPRQSLVTVQYFLHPKNGR